MHPNLLINAEWKKVLLFPSILCYRLPQLRPVADTPWWWPGLYCFKSDSGQKPITQWYLFANISQLGHSALTAPTAVALLKSVSTLSRFSGKPTFRYCSTSCVFRATILSVTLEIWISVHGIMICCPFLKYGLSTANTGFYERVYRHIYVVCGCRLCRARALEDTVGTGVNEGSELAINSHGHFPHATPIYHHTGGNQPQLDIGIDISATSC